MAPTSAGPTATASAPSTNSPGMPPGLGPRTATSSSANSNSSNNPLYYNATSTTSLQSSRTSVYDAASGGYAISAGFMSSASVVDLSNAADRMAAAYYSQDLPDSVALLGSRQSSTATLYPGPQQQQQAGYGTDPFAGPPAPPRGVSFTVGTSAASSPHLSGSPLRPQPQQQPSVDSPKDSARRLATAPSSEFAAHKPLPSVPQQRASPGAATFTSSPSPGVAQQSSDIPLQRLSHGYQYGSGGADLSRSNSHETRKSGSGTPQSTSTAYGSPQLQRRQLQAVPGAAQPPSNPVPISTVRTAGQQDYAAYQAAANEFPSPVSAGSKSSGGLAFVPSQQTLQQAQVFAQQYQQQQQHQQQQNQNQMMAAAVAAQAAYKTPTSSAGSGSSNRSSSDETIDAIPPPNEPVAQAATTAAAVATLPRSNPSKPSTTTTTQQQQQQQPQYSTGSLKRTATSQHPVIQQNMPGKPATGGHPTSSGAAVVSSSATGTSGQTGTSKTAALTSYVANAMKRASQYGTSIVASASGQGNGGKAQAQQQQQAQQQVPKRPGEAGVAAIPSASVSAPAIAAQSQQTNKISAIQLQQELQRQQLQHQQQQQQHVQTVSVPTYVSPLNSQYNLQAAAALQQQLTQQQLYLQQQGLAQHHAAQQQYAAQQAMQFAAQQQNYQRPYGQQGTPTFLNQQHQHSPSPSGMAKAAPSAAQLEFSFYSDGREAAGGFARAEQQAAMLQQQQQQGRTSRSQWPMSPEAVLMHLPHLLTVYERTEIVGFPLIHFLGSATAEKIGSGRKRSQANVEINRPDPSTSDAGTSDPPDADGTYNNGYDDARGDYILTLNDHIQYRYEITGLLGKGSFGQVVKCWDHKEGREVAVKIIRNKRRFEKQGLVECRVLDTLKKEDHNDSHNIIHMLDHFHFRGHLCITFELLGLNLYEWLKAGGFKGVGVHVIRRFSEQILQCLDLLANKRIVHCDLKPENVLLKEVTHTHPSYADSNHLSSSSSSSSSTAAPSISSQQLVSHSWYSIKVIDFGSSCFEDEKVYTYVQSRFYRSPEVILGISYNMSIDMWSLGCILAELYTGYPLFPGENEQEQLACIMEVKGVPEKELMEKGTRRKLFFDSTGAPRPFTNSKGKRRKPSTKTLPGVLRCNDASFIDFIERCLEWDPTKRMTPAQALAHEFVTGVPASGFAVPKSIAPRPSTLAATGEPTGAASRPVGAGQQVPIQQIRAPTYPAPRPHQPGKALEEGRAAAAGYPVYGTTASAASSSSSVYPNAPTARSARTTAAVVGTTSSRTAASQAALSMQPVATTNIPPTYASYAAAAPPSNSGSLPRQPSTGQTATASSPARTQRTMGSTASPASISATSSTSATRKPPVQQPQQQPWR